MSTFDELMIRAGDRLLLRPGDGLLLRPGGGTRGITGLRQHPNRQRHGVLPISLTPVADRGRFGAAPYQGRLSIVLGTGRRSHR